MERMLDRRQFTAFAAAAAALGVAGCTDDDDAAAPEDDGDGTEDQDGGDTADDGEDDGLVDGDEDGGEDEDGADGGDGGGDAQERAESWLSENDANAYDDELDDHTGEDEVTVMVGAGDDSLAFDPPGIRIDTGTTVVWEWTGEGGNHNVAPDGDTDFEDFGQSEQTDEEGHTTEDTFDETGVGLYVCEPHMAQGMYGAVVVE